MASPVRKVPTVKATDEAIRLFISGERGPAPMTGVQTFPYTVSQRLYHDEFSAIAAATIQHPYMATAKPCGSTPHNILSGSAISDRTVRVSEQTHAYSYKSSTASKKMPGSGVRVEQGLW